MNPEMREVNYIAIREELSSGGCLDGECLKAFLSIGLEHVSDLIKEKKTALFGLEQQTEEFRQYLTEAVLWRMINLYEEAVKKGIKEADSITLYEKLRDVVCERLFLPKDSLSEHLLSGLFTEGLDSFFNNEPSADVMAKVSLVSKFVSQIIPDNPKTENRVTPFILD